MKKILPLTILMSASLWAAPTNKSTPTNLPKVTTLIPQLLPRNPNTKPPPSPVQIVRTNANHDRACEALASQTLGKITAQPREFSPIPLPGAGEGETAFFHPSTRTLVVGDALIHLFPQPLMPLPEKYCTNPTQLKSSLSQLFSYPIERIFFAHGAPILQDGCIKLRSLLE